jgi:hypothetical protein
MHKTKFMAHLTHMVLDWLRRNGFGRFAALLPLSLTVLPVSAAAMPQSAWVQAVADGFEARVVTDAATCPLLMTDKGEKAMTPRAAADPHFPLLCSAPLTKNLTAMSIAGAALPLPKAQPQRILVLGDTGCRINGSDLQDCGDPQKWPFPSVAVAAAALKPDLVIHLGDYLYRESPCPPGNSGCSGSAWGDNWPSWKADFFAPAAPLLASAPIVLARGNHEDCTRAGSGFLRLLGPFALDPATACNPHLPVYTVDLGGLTLAVMDDAAAPDTDIDGTFLPAFTREIRNLGNLPAPVWFVHHRPIWSPIAGPLDIPVGGNRTLIAAAGKSLIPPTVQLMLSGHIHTFEAINYQRRVPPQIVAGNGGDELHHAPRDLRGSIFQGRSGVMVKDGLSVGGFGFLLFVRDTPSNGSAWTVELYKPDGTMEGTCRLTPGADGRRARLDCPDLAGK